MAFYFGWMHFYSTYMIMPAVVGLAMYFFRPSGITVDTDPYLPFFSVFMAIWAVLFIVVSSCRQKLSTSLYKVDIIGHSLILSLDMRLKGQTLGCGSKLTQLHIHTKVHLTSLEQRTGETEP